MIENSISGIEESMFEFVALEDGIGYSRGDRVIHVIELDTDAQPPEVLSISWFNNTSPIAPPIPEHFGRPE